MSGTASLKNDPIYMQKIGIEKDSDEISDEYQAIRFWHSRSKLDSLATMLLQHTPRPYGVNQIRLDRFLWILIGPL